MDITVPIPVDLAQRLTTSGDLARRVADGEPDLVNLAEAIRRRFAPIGGVDDLVIPPREPAREPPRFDRMD